MLKNGLDTRAHEVLFNKYGVRRIYIPFCGLGRPTAFVVSTKSDVREPGEWMLRVLCENAVIKFQGVAFGFYAGALTDLVDMWREPKKVVQALQPYESSRYPSPKWKEKHNVDARCLMVLEEIRKTCLMERCFDGVQVWTIHFWKHPHSSPFLGEPSCITFDNICGRDSSYYACTAVLDAIEEKEKNEKDSR